MLFDYSIVGYNIKMLRLHILRHVNTAWALPGQRDFDRELNDEGMSDLPIIQSWIKDHKIKPEHVYCSSAERTRATLEGIKHALPGEPAIEYMDSFYSGYIEEYMTEIQLHPDNSNLMIVGHNPTCASLVSLLVSPDDAEGSQVVSNSFPPGAMAIIDFDISNWSELKQNSGKLIEFLVPRTALSYEA